MEKLLHLFEDLKTKFDQMMERLGRKLFGPNNENLDFFVDSFNRLDNNQKIVVGALSALVLFFSVIFVFWVYFAQVASLRSEMSRSFQAVQEIQSLQAELTQEEMRFDSLTSKIEKKISNLRVKPYFESLSKKIGVTIDDIEDQSISIESSDPLSDKFENILIDLRLNKISIPRLLSLIMEFEKSDQLLRLQDLTIRSRYGTKLYFDASLKVMGYQFIGS